MRTARSALDAHCAADGGEQLDARRVEHTHLVLASEEGGDADVGEGCPADDAMRPELVLADPGSEREALVRSIPERDRPRVVLDVQTALGGQRVGHPGVVVNVIRLGSFRAVVDRVEREVRAREDVELEPRILLPRARVVRSRSSPKATPEAEDLRIADAAVQMHVARFDLRLLSCNRGDWCRA